MRHSKFSNAYLAAFIVALPFLLHCSHMTNAAKVPTQSSVPLTERVSTLLFSLNADFKRLSVPFSYSSWEAYTKGTPEAYDKMATGEKAMNDFLSSGKTFAQLKQVREEAAATAAIDPLDRRQLDIYYFQFAGNQVSPALLDEITDLSTKIQKEFNTFRVKLGDKEVSEIELRETLKKSTDSKVLKEAWEASKAVGERVEKDLKQLVRLRNKKAVQLGFPNFHAMSLAMDEHTTAWLVEFFSSLDKETTANFRRAKTEFDGPLAKRLGIAVADLRPWHYQDPFFQVAPEVEAFSLDTLYDKAEIKQLTETFYDGIGLPLPGVFAKSDLYPRDKKSTHAFCYDLDREGDTRVLANITPSDQWMTTMLHEFGHAVYSSTYIPQRLPFLLRDAAHTLTTEGIAMMFERESKRKDWLTATKLLPKEPAKQKTLLASAQRQMKSRLLVFSRWAQVMFQFEKKMYENPDADLNALWWDLVEKYQELKRPEGRNKPDYAAKVHIVTAPVYYHNYLLGEVFASQVHHALAKQVGKGADPHRFAYVGKKGVGEFLQKHIMDLGRVYPWTEMVEKATGQPLNTKAFAYDTK